MFLEKIYIYKQKKRLIKNLISTIPTLKLVKFRHHTTIYKLFLECLFFFFWVGLNIVSGQRSHIHKVGND